MCQASTQRTSRPYAKVKIRTSEHGRVLNVALSAMLQCGIIMCGKFEGFPQKGYVVLWGSWLLLELQELMSTKHL